MVSSLAVSVVLLILARQGFGLSSHLALVTTVIATTACWVATAYLAPQTDPEVLRAFYLKVRPGGPGWGPVRASLGVAADAAVGDPLPLALVGWAVGCTLVWSSLFAIGQALYGEWTLAAVLASTAIVERHRAGAAVAAPVADSEPSATVPGGSPR